MCESGDNVIVVSPGNPKFSAVCTAHGVHVKELVLSYETTQTHPNASGQDVQIDTWDYNFQSLAKLIDLKTKFLYILNPNWSIGQLLPEKAIRELILVGEDRQIPIIVDETFSSFPWPNQKITKFGQFNKKTPIISINSASRLFGLSG
jgi:aspartate/methionine/tyrosine aminotransferase